MLRASWIALFLVACGKPPEPVSQEIADVGRRLFQHFDDEDPTVTMEADIATLRDYILTFDEETLLTKTKDTAVTMPVLNGDFLGGLSVPEGVSASAQIPVALSAISVHDVDTQLGLVLEPNQVCIESATTTWAGREFLTDTACFEDKSCDSLSVSQEIFKENALAKVWYDQFKDYRWFEFDDADGNPVSALIGRSWNEERFVGEATLGSEASWDQLFHLDVNINDPGDDARALRWFSLWSSVQIPGIGDDDFAGLAKAGIAEALLFGDEFLSNDIQSCKNDRDNEKPPRD
jgi:hypothetical protein